MRISGFTMARNAAKLYYPIKASISSILPIVDEFVVALGEGDADDRTREEIKSINSPKIRIVETRWDIEEYPNGMENARQTDIAKSHCSGDWLFYLQADEVVHENALPFIKSRCAKLLEEKEIEGLLFDYLHFWGDYGHYHNGHGWYKHEIRIIRNDPDIHSWKSAQSFRRIPEFDGHSYRQKKNTFKLKVAKAEASIFHYGWVRPPHLMVRKNKSLDTIHQGKEAVSRKYDGSPDQFDYGPLGVLPVFRGSHPSCMQDMIARFNWKDQLDYGSQKDPKGPNHKHLKLRNRLLTYLESNVLHRSMGGSKNFILLDR